MASRTQVVIIGGGFTGAAAAIHLSRVSRDALDIRIIEPRERVGMGVAHSASEPDLRLNGPADIHAPYPDAPADFLHWMTRSGELGQDPQATTTSGRVFARRGAFGRYMAHEVDRHAQANASGSRIDHVRDVATDAVPEAHHVDITLRGGGRLRADHCVLALGWNEVAAPRELAGLTAHPGWLGDPWQTGRLGEIPREAPVLLIGSGLTASDMFAALVARGHTGPVTSISRRGLRPASQNPQRAAGPLWDRVLDPAPPLLARLGQPLSLRRAVAALREQMALAQTNGGTWHTPFDEMRDAAWRLWPAWPLREQQQYLRHLKGWYDAFRFRNPPQTESILRAGIDRGQLQFLRGRLREARTHGQTLSVAFSPGSGADLRHVSAEAVINCTGPSPRPRDSRNPLWQALLQRSAAHEAPCGIGIQIDGEGRVVDGAGRAQPRLWAVGPPTLGCVAEAVAVPYIVRDIRRITDRITSAAA